MLGKISLNRRLRVVFPLDDAPLTPTTIAFRVLAMVEKETDMRQEREQAARCAFKTLTVPRLQPVS